MLKGKIGKICFSRLSEGEDLTEAIKRGIEEWNVKAGIFFVIGTLKRATLGYYRNRQYKVIHLNGPLEIASCIGNVALDEKNEAIIHAHIVVSNVDGEAFGGHLMEGSPVDATAELMLLEGEGIKLQRALDEKTNLKLLKLS
ncbi:MAG: DUF296 domain-containing protein [Candidatus Bathyarchaeia archaeon]